MTLLKFSDVSLAFGAMPLLDKVSWQIARGERVCIIGRNGTGKSSMLRLVKGEQKGDDGDIWRAPGLKIGELPQELPLADERTVFDVVAAGLDGVGELLAQFHHLSQNIQGDEDLEKLMHVQHELEARDGWRLQQVVESTLSRLQLPADKTLAELSGGWRRRVLLAQALVSEPDLLLLDEPTNHLDINTIRWLETVLTARNSTMVIISHDRHFLNSVCTHMADLDYGELRLFPGNYDEYMTAATQAREQLLSDNAKKKAQIAELQTFVSRFSANASKAKQATSRAKQIDKIQLAEVKPSSRVSPFIRFEQTKKLHRQAVTVEKMAKAFDDKVLFKDLGFTVEAGERVAIIGPNGIGKTTLLRTLVGEMTPDKGEVKWTDSAEVGYYAQDHAHDFEDDMTLFDWMGQWTSGEQVIRGTLGRMLFSNDEILKSVKVISGGEQGRMLFGKLILQKPNVLVMDEPTNHLDMESIEALNLALENYPGTLLFVSHDREFVSSLATRIIELSADGVVDFSGTYDEYLRSQGVVA